MRAALLAGSLALIACGPEFTVAGPGAASGAGGAGGQSPGPASGSGGATAGSVTSSSANAASSSSSSSSSASASASSSSSASSGAGGGGALACDDRYGGTEGYLFCLEQADRCEFQFGNLGQSCTEACAKGGADCIDAFDNSGACGHGPHAGCGFVGHDSSICICGNTCGNGPACPLGQQCVSGICQ